MVFLKKKAVRRIILPCVIVLLIVLACAIYLGDYYRADAASIAAFAPANAVEQTQDKSGNLIFAPEGAHTGFIFYPGGKVEHSAYVPLMQSLAAEGIFCVLVEMPFRLAVLDSDAAKDIAAQYPQIENWYIGGHSLGGSMAAAYLADCAEDFKGLILLGSYSTADLSETGLAVLSVYGSEDLVMNREKYALNKENLPADFTELVIDGGSHAQFGMYGAQDGDGSPTISGETQIALTSAAILEMLGAAA